MKRILTAVLLVTCSICLLSVDVSAQELTGTLKQIKNSGKLLSVDDIKKLLS